jgi:hypothetical protein
MHIPPGTMLPVVTGGYFFAIPFIDSIKYCVGTYTCIYMHIYVCVYIYMYVYMYIDMYICI